MRIEKDEITAEQKQRVILQYGMTFEDVAYYTVKKKHGVEVVSPHYNYKDAKDIEPNHLIDVFQIAYNDNKLSKEYQEAKRHLNVDSKQANRIRTAVSYL